MDEHQVRQLIREVVAEVLREQEWRRTAAVQAAHAKAKSRRLAALGRTSQNPRPNLLAIARGALEPKERT